MRGKSTIATTMPVMITMATINSISHSPSFWSRYLIFSLAPYSSLPPRGWYIPFKILRQECHHSPVTPAHQHEFPFSPLTCETRQIDTWHCLVTHIRGVITPSFIKNLGLVWYISLKQQCNVWLCKLL